MTWYRASGGIPQSVKNLKTPTSVTGAGVSFNTDLTDNLIKCVSDINAVQSGSGIPSPSNPRAISGHTDCVITSNSIPVTVALGQTVYGGHLNVLSGKLTITHILITYNGSESESWSKVTGTGKFYIINSNLPDYVLTNKISNVYPFSGEARGSTYVTIDKSFYTQTDTVNWQYNRFWIYNSDYEEYSVTQFRYVLSNQPITILVELVTPTTVQLSSNQIATISGQNTISADTGDIDITYLETVGHKIS